MQKKQWATESIGHFVFKSCFCQLFGLCDQFSRYHLMLILCFFTYPAHLQFKVLVLYFVMDAVDAEEYFSHFPAKKLDLHLGDFVYSLSCSEFTQLELFYFSLCSLFCLSCWCTKVSLSIISATRTGGLQKRNYWLTYETPEGSIMYSWGPDLSCPARRTEHPNGLTCE